MGEEQITSKHGKDRLEKYARYAIEAYAGSVQDTLENVGQELPTLIRNQGFFAKVCDRVGRQYRKDALAGEAWLKNVLPKLG